jgi:acyl carrier protein
LQHSEVFAKLQEVFDSTFLERVVVTPQLSAAEVSEWDSLAHISLIIAVEETFNVKFRTGEVEGTKNVGDLANLILKHLNKSSI